MQDELIAHLRECDLLLFNPRRAHFSMNDPDAARAQIEWEHRHLRVADAISFWFPRETLCPIVLFELGAWAYTSPLKKLFVGVHPSYERRADVEIQLQLQRPEIEIVTDLQALADQIAHWCRDFDPRFDRLGRGIPG